MAGKLNRHGNFGEIREGWVADLLLINGDPLRDTSERYAEMAAVLPAHGDPFDRAIAAHALAYADNVLISADPVFRGVPALNVVW